MEEAIINTTNIINIILTTPSRTSTGPRCFYFRLRPLLLLPPPQLLFHTTRYSLKSVK
jgi:hypothetical protein